VSSVQVKHVPTDVREELARRAATAGQSLQEYLLAHLTELARTTPLEEVLARAGSHRGGSAPIARAAKLVRAERDAR
jgi:hypothetical protein